MDWAIFSFLAADALQNGTIYALLALSLVLVFAVTRVILVPLGEFLVYAPLTYVWFLPPEVSGLNLRGQIPGTAWLAAAMLAGWAFLERKSLRRAGLLALGSLGVLGLAWWGAQGVPLWLGWFLAVLVVLPIGPASYRLFFEPAKNASVLTYLIIAVGLHFAFMGLGLVFFGPEQFRLPAVWSGQTQVGLVPINNQAFLVYGFAFLSALGLYLFFSRSIYGKALRACAVNRYGARLSGISPSQAGYVSFSIATLIACVSGMLLAPLISPAYFQGFLLGLKGFVAGILGGLVSYPLAALGALLVGAMESWAAFQASAYKDAIVFALLLPILFWRSLRSQELGEEE
ncbi:MAG: branched-chain amino acid ABC transporter permease [Meiothermus sp.]|uniref:branched-chain amino acid ABC transporter permease n=1 Tax=Meiothermus sp. TaxID=1955249 RepID=UPI0025DA0904|nr:branched-chain amino acid ABC transporter permease [Meiothermus sp.]MCS7059171.1 branched-chain amino acid ABC transporter permease [Meiothermus sp.]MCS7194853.1 branched-chain amino acid ABC transporter permease [Meiothermus sp.]MDW8090385.1 branched-chain amino acid ABC transporter permease [Meiothermus sp.]MDW8481113.1 branched-chain amino acid ABC transporter permease [Meiothermus sp.]